MNSGNVFFIDYEAKKRNTAGSKAPSDVAEICRKEGYLQLSMPLFAGKTGSLYQKLWLLTVGTAAWYKNAYHITKGAIVFYQHPSYGMRTAKRFLRHLQKKKNCKLIVLIHDLESLRGGIQGVIQSNRRTSRIADNEFLKSFDAVICHNEHMREYLLRQGFRPERLVSLELFDYLTNAIPKPHTDNCSPSVVIAGNLAPGKCGYLYKIFDGNSNSGLTVNLYGNGFDDSYAGHGLIWRGSFPPESLPELLKGDYGLVWDGPSAETCAGNTGAYLRFNNPHKTSLYLVSGIPVIVWSKAAIADFVLAHNVGITIDSLYELKTAISSVSPEKYRQMSANANILSAELKDGLFFRRALQKAFSVLQTETESHL